MDGRLWVHEVKSARRPDDAHTAQARLYCLAMADRGVAVLGERVGRVMTGKVFTLLPASPRERGHGADDRPTVPSRPVVVHDGRPCGIGCIGALVKRRVDEIRGEAEAIREYISGSR